MKKALTLLLVFLTSFQLSGGYALAATVTSVAAGQAVAVPGKTSVSEKKGLLLQYLNQLLQQENDETEKANYLPDLLGVCPQVYAYLPIFSVQNKHFLVHYAVSIKSKLPTRYLLLQVFRL